MTTQKFQDARSQIDLGKTRAKFWTFGLNRREPERSDQHQLNKLPEPNTRIKNKDLQNGKYYPSHPIQCR
jgi:hypothetical protein